MCYLGLYGYARVMLCRCAPVLRSQLHKRCSGISSILTEREGRQPCISIRPYPLGVASLDTEVQPATSTKAPLAGNCSFNYITGYIGRSGRASTRLLCHVSSGVEIFRLTPDARAYLPSKEGVLFAVGRDQCFDGGGHLVHLSPGVPGQHNALAPNFHIDGRTGSKPLPVEPANRAFSHEQGRRARTGGGVSGDGTLARVTLRSVPRNRAIVSSYLPWVIRWALPVDPVPFSSHLPKEDCETPRWATIKDSET